jgi:hypothetical protein
MQYGEGNTPSGCFSGLTVESRKEPLMLSRPASLTDDRLLCNAGDSFCTSLHIASPNRFLFRAGVEEEALGVSELCRPFGLSIVSRYCRQRNTKRWRGLYHFLENYINPIIFIVFKHPVTLMYLFILLYFRFKCNLLSLLTFLSLHVLVLCGHHQVLPILWAYSETLMATQHLLVAMYNQNIQWQRSGTKY